jgi:methylmalonyl-CoA mutase N-terminal domain/subunit
MSERKSESGIKYDSTPISTTEPEAGEFPYRSGIHKNMYKTRPWTIRQYAGFGNAHEANSRLKSLIESGATGLSIAFDLPTQMGLDPDNELASAEVGKVGVSIACLDDMRQLLEGIDISQISTSMTINATAPILLLMYQIVAEERGIKIDSLRGTIQNDILKEYIARGTYIFPPLESLNLAVETIIYCNQYLPNWNSISISGYHMSEAGATAVQEIAFTFANAIEYLNTLITKGIQVDEIAPRVSFFFASKITFFEEIAKFRAARQIWASIMKDQFGSKNPKSWQIRFHTQTAGAQLIAQNPEINIVRVTLQSLGALFGGTQSLHTNAFDEAIALPSNNSARIALQTQQVIMEETDLTFAADPFKGSFLIENMTNQMIEEINKEMDKIDSLGGALKCIQSGYQLEKIETNAFDIARRVEEGSMKIIGLNFGVLSKENLLKDELTKTPEVTDSNTIQILKTKKVSADIQSAMKALGIAASKSYALLPAIKECILVGATVGEICQELSKAWENAND